jgi:hypothetical protein
MMVLGVSGVGVCATLALQIEHRVNDPYLTFTVLTITLPILIPLLRRTHIAYYIQYAPI